MFHDTFAPWEHYPKNLNQSEIQNPLTVIIDFFSTSSLKGHKRDLKEWRYFVTAKRHYKGDRHGPGSLRFTYDLNLKLLEALHLLWLSYQKNRLHFKETSEELLQEEKAQWLCFPKNLKTKELANPYFAITKAFKEMGPQQYREQLHEWLHSALYRNSADETISSAELLTVYQNLLKLYSAAWLIHQRETDRTMLKNGWQKKEKTVASEKVVMPEKAALAETIKAVTPIVASEKTELSEPKLKEIPLKEIDPNPSPAEKLELEEVKKVILILLPEVVMMTHLGTHPEPFTYFLLILLSDAENRPESEVSNKVEDSLRYLANIHAFVHKANSAKIGVANGRRFWNKALSKGKTIYKSGTTDVVTPVNISSDILLERANFQWRRWGTQGKAFLKGAAFYLENHNFSLALFMLHAATESILKAVIQAVLGYHVVTHNLSRLFRITLLFTEGLNATSLHQTQDGQHRYELLHKAYLQTRYHSEANPDPSSVGILLQEVGKLIEIAESTYAQYILNLSNPHR